ncbi:MAG: segregation/condensation protein A [Planctomycetota bacterium]
MLGTAHDLPRVSTEHFDGPLDLLLHLVRKRELPLVKVSLLDVAEEFAQRIAEDALEPDVVGEALVVAATLVEMKSNALLPKPGPVDLPSDDAGDRLVEQLLEYARFRKAAEQFEQMAEEASRSHVVRIARNIDRPREKTFDLDNLTPDLLRDVYVKVVQDLEHRTPPRFDIEEDTVPIEVVKERTLDRLQARPMSLGDLLDVPGKATRIATLLALLDLLRDGVVRLCHGEPA